MSDPKTDEAAKPAAPKTKLMEVKLLRGYNPQSGAKNKKLPGDVIEVSEATGKKLIKLGIATFPDED
ncbi:MAG: hypothetical protein JJ979_05760 [Roseibium sp.]|nr:hypothetical protein [Roseibium sp.]